MAHSGTSCSAMRQFKIGNMEVKVLLTPGHTPASIAYLVGDTAFVHDTIFMPDGGTARADSLAAARASSGRAFNASWHCRMALACSPDTITALQTQKPLWESTVAQQRAENIHLTKAKTEDEFVALREKRDRELPMPS